MRLTIFFLVLLVSHSANGQRDKRFSLEAGLDYETGRAIFEKIWVSSPASTSASDGLGPYYNARSCAQCHLNNFLVIQLDDEVYGQQLQTFAVPGLPAEGSFKVSYSSLLVKLADNKEVSLQVPSYELENLQFGALNSEQLSPRRAASLAGIGLLGLIPEQAISALADEYDANDDGISGRISLVWDLSEESYTMGRFGWKASQANLPQQLARAFNLDMGISTSWYPDAYGDCTTFQEGCLQMPNGNSAQHEGLEAGKLLFESLLFYVKNIPLPLQSVNMSVDLSAEESKGEEFFLNAGCQACHHPQFEVAGELLSPYSDLLLHDMGSGLADGVDLEPKIEALHSEWRTTPLWGLDERHVFLHDGRAKSLEEAILWHSGEAISSVERFRSMTQAQRDDLISFLKSL